MKNDLTGKKFNRYTVKKFAYKKYTANVWECICDCGNIRYKTTSELKTGKSKSCGCYRKDVHWIKTRVTKVGKIYGHLEVLSFHDSKEGGSRFLCKCTCGKEKIVRSINLREGSILSCGCKGELENFTSVVNIIFSTYKNRARKKKIEFNLNRSLFQEKIDSPCFYCGKIKSNTQKGCLDREYQYNGLDRIDSSEGYIEENVVTCCVDCNIAKGTKTQEEFLNFIKRVYNFQENK